MPPSGLDFSPLGVVFVADYDAPGVVRVDSAAGTGVGLATGAPFDEPLDLEFGPDGMIYVAEDFGVPGVYRVNPSTGAVTTVVAGAPFATAYALVVTPSGRIYVVDGNDTVFTIAPGAGTATVAATLPASSSLQGIEQRPDGKLYVADETSPGKIFLVDPRTGAFDEVASDPLLGGQYNIALEPGGTLVSSVAAPAASSGSIWPRTRSARSALTARAPRGWPWSRLAAAASWQRSPEPASVT